MANSKNEIHKDNTPKEIYIEDLDGDGVYGGIDTELVKMEGEIEKIEHELQAISNEDGLEMISELRSVLGKIKLAADSSMLKQLIDKARDIKKDVNTELSRVMKDTDEGKERIDEIEKRLKELLNALEKSKEQEEPKLIIELKSIDRKQIEKDPIRVIELIQKGQQMIKQKEKERPLIAKIAMALKSVFIDKQNKALAVNTKDKDKEKQKQLPIEASIIEKKRKQKQIEKQANLEQDIPQNNELIGVINNLANNGEVKLLEKVLDDNSNNLQVSDYAKILNKKVMPNMSLDKLKGEVKLKAIGNRVNKTMKQRNISIHKPHDAKFEKDNNMTKTSEKPGMEMTLGIKNSNND